MNIAVALFLSVILLSNVYTIGAPQSQPDSIIPSAFAAEFFCPAKAGGYIIDPDEHRIANGSFYDTVYCDYGLMKDFWYGRDFESVGGCFCILSTYWTI